MAMNEITKEGIRVFQAGDRQKAARILAHAVRIDVRDEEAWYWLSACVDDLEQKLYCLRRVLHINPQNAKARRRLERLQSIGEPAIQTEPAEAVRPQFPMIRWWAVALGIVILIGSGIWIATLWQNQPGRGDLAVVLSEVDQRTVEPRQEILLADEPVLIPVTGNEIIISGSGSQETDAFYLPAKKIKVIWQYSGSPEEDNRLREVTKGHKEQIRLIDEAYSTCMKEQKAELDFAIIRQDADHIARSEQAIEACIREHDQSKSSQNLKYYDELDYYSTSISIVLHRHSVDEPTKLVEKKGIYYGTTTFEAEEGRDYYLVVKASGPWSVKFD
jgi:hypothetical protein